MRAHLEVLCRRAGLPYGRKVGGVTFHWSTRRTRASALFKGVPLTVVQRQGGWKNPDILLEIYSEARDEDVLKAVGALPTHSQSKRKRA